MKKGTKNPKKRSSKIEYFITAPLPSGPHRDKPMLSIGSGLLVIEDCSCSSVTLDINAARELHRLLPGLISILEPLCSGNGLFTFGHIP